MFCLYCLSLMVFKVLIFMNVYKTGDMPSSDRTRLDIHTKNQRIYFLVTRDEQRDPLLPPTLQEKRHVLISLLQDYRHGPSTANSLLVPIGFCLYKVSSSDSNFIVKEHIVDVVVAETKLLGCLLLVAQCHSMNDNEDIWD